MTARRHASGLLAGLFVATVSTLCALAAIEGAVRALHLVPAKFWEPDPVLGTRLVAGKSGWYTQEEHEFRVPVQINRAGFRDVEHAPVKPAGVTRVLVLGDSYIEAMHVALEETFTRQLERELNGGGGSRYEVIAMGVSGYGTAAELLTYGQHGRAYRPDVVILAFYPGNDVRNNSPTLEPALRPVYDGNGMPARLLALGRPRAERNGSPWRTVLAHSQAYAYVRKRILTQHPAAADWLAQTGLLAREAINRVPMEAGVPVDYWVYAAQPSPEWDDAWRRTETLLGQLRAAVEADGAHFVVVVVTAREIIYPESWEQILATYPAMRAVTWNLAGPEQRLARWCDAQRLRCIPLTPAFSARRDVGERLHYVYDGHWTAAGHALAARTVAAALQGGD